MPHVLGEVRMLPVVLEIGAAHEMTLARLLALGVDIEVGLGGGETAATAGALDLDAGELPLGVAGRLWDDSNLRVLSGATGGLRCLEI